MWRDFDAAVMAGGHCGFGLGATSSAAANMKVLVGRHSPAPSAFFVVPHSTVSRVAAAFPQLEALARAGLSVVSSCEELLFPQLRAPELARASTPPRVHGDRATVAALVNTAARILDAEPGVRLMTDLSAPRVS